MTKVLERAEARLKDRFISGLEIIGNESIKFPPEGMLCLNGESIPGLMGQIRVNSLDNTITWSGAMGDGKKEPSPGCQVYVAPFHGLSEVYSQLERRDDNLLRRLAGYNMTERLVAGESVRLRGQDTIILKATSLDSSTLGVDLARFNYIDMQDGKGLESVTIEQRLAVNQGEAVNLSCYLRRGKNTVHLVSGNDTRVYQWANTLELGNFMPAGYSTESGIKMDQPYNTLHGHQVTLRLSKHGVEVCAVASGGKDGNNTRFGVRYMGELVTNSPVNVKPRELLIGDDVFALDGDLQEDSSLVGIEFNGSTPENRQSLAVFRIVIDSQTGDLGLVYIKSTDMGSRSGLSSVKYSPILPVKREIGLIEEVIYVGSDSSEQANDNDLVEGLYLRMLSHARYFQVDNHATAPKVKRAEHPAILFRR